MSVYRIIREDFFDEKGRSLKTVFFIQEKCKFLFFTKWKYVTHKNIGVKPLRKVPLHFNGMTEAETFVKEVLKDNKNYMGHHRFVLKIID